MTPCEKDHVSTDAIIPHHAYAHATLRLDREAVLILCFVEYQGTSEEIIIEKNQIQNSNNKNKNVPRINNKPR